MAKKKKTRRKKATRRPTQKRATNGKRPKKASLFEQALRDAAPVEKRPKNAARVRELVPLYFESVKAAQHSQELAKKAEADRDGIASEIVMLWGRGHIILDGEYFTAASYKGRPIIRRLTAEDGVIV